MVPRSNRAATLRLRFIGRAIVQVICNPVIGLAERRPAWTQAALRNFVLNATDRQNSRGERIAGNGLAEAGAIVRVGRRVLIDEAAFFRWIAEQQKRGRAR